MTHWLRTVWSRLSPRDIRSHWEWLVYLQRFGGLP
jgi:hypothetical protein